MVAAEWIFMRQNNLKFIYKHLLSKENIITALCCLCSRVFGKNPNIFCKNLWRTPPINRCWIPMPWLSTRNNITGTQKFVSVESLERFSMLALSRTLSRLALQASRKIPANFRKPLLSPSPYPRRMRRCKSEIPRSYPRYSLSTSRGLGGRGFHWPVHYCNCFVVVVLGLSKYLPIFFRYFIKKRDLSSNELNDRISFKFSFTFPHFQKQSKNLRQ